jgi:hypothetical protein
LLLVMETSLISTIAISMSVSIAFLLLESGGLLCFARAADFSCILFSLADCLEDL